MRKKVNVGQLLDNQIFAKTLLKHGLAVLGLSFLVACTGQTSSVDNIFGPSATSAPGGSPTSLIPNDSGAVQTSSLPPIDGQSPPTDGGSDVSNIPQDGQISIADGVGTDSSFLDLDNGGNNLQVASRTISDPAQKEQLIGGWTILAGPAQCRLFLTLTAKQGKYRASTPGCEAPKLKSVGTWSLEGGKVLLFNRSGTKIATFVQSGNRFVGTLFDGTGASLAG